MPNDLLKTLTKNSSNQIPIWLMRQAGRYLPEYKKIRNKKHSFLDLCYDANLASEVTLQPLQRFDLNAAIIFSDILVIPDSMGIEVVFEEKTGPSLKKIKNLNDLKTLQSNKKILNSVYEAITLTKKKLNPNNSLIGFAGAPWTLASYIVEGKLSKDLSFIKSYFYNDPSFIFNLINLLVEEISCHIINQISNGADIIQIFDSWAGVLTGNDYQKLIIEPNKKIIENVKKVFPNVPIICFPRMSGHNYKNFCEQVPCDAISVDQYVDLGWILDNCNDKVIQGNLDPVLLLCESQELLKDRIDYILEVTQGQNLIFNLGHGVLPETKIENVEFLVNYVKSYKK